jgi:uncharacterized protein YecE (DUF72 family)
VLRIQPVGSLIVRKQYLHMPSPEVRIDCSSWTSPAWTDLFYPPGTGDGDRLRVYVRAFDTVGVDSTCYRPAQPLRGPRMG